MQKEEEVSIIYHKYCPFAQRALITAIEKEVDAKFIPTGLGDDTKSELFTSAYSRSIARDPTSNGKVPVLIHGPHYITESELVCWYLAESFPTGTQLIPEDKLLRLQMRVWMGQINSQIINLFNRSKAGKITNVPAFVAEVDSFLQRV